MQKWVNYTHHLYLCPTDRGLSYRFEFRTRPYGGHGACTCWGSGHGSPCRRGRGTNPSGCTERWWGTRPAAHGEITPGPTLGLETEQCGSHHSWVLRPWELFLLKGTKQIIFLNQIFAIRNKDKSKKFTTAYKPGKQIESHFPITWTIIKTHDLSVYSNKC